jgi:hypothetical protein
VRLVLRQRELDLTSSRHLRTFLIMVPVIAVIASVSTVGNRWFDGLIPKGDFGSTMAAEAAANALGILLVAPAFLLLLTRCVERILSALAGEEKLAAMPRVDGKWKTALLVGGCAAAFLSAFSFSTRDRFALFCLSQSACRGGVETWQSRGGRSSCRPGIVLPQPRINTATELKEASGFNRVHRLCREFVDTGSAISQRRSQERTTWRQAAF